MKDINGIDLCNGDLVLFTLKDYRTFEYGLIYNDKIISTTSSHSNLTVYKILQLSAKEENIKNQILDRINKLEHKKSARKEIKFLSNRGQVAGNSYCTLAGDILLYMGKCNINKKEQIDNFNFFSYEQEASTKITSLTGHCYIYLGYVSFDIDYNVVKETYFRHPVLADTVTQRGYISISKNKKRVLKECSYKSPIMTKNFVYSVNRNNKQIGYEKVEVIK